MAMTRTEMAAYLGVSRVAVSNWLLTYKKESLRGIKRKKGGRRSEDMKLLKPHECVRIVNLITDRCPDQLKLPFMLWTRESVGLVIEQEFEVSEKVNSWCERKNLSYFG